ncbi:MAG: alpha/beta fold hydrolase [Steroidobacteraceae bacterium]|nr:alpha/beta fold hydrolase [Steroidobacteraceae bacterium]
MRAQFAGMTGGLAPEVYVLAWLDWCTNLAQRPATQLELGGMAASKAIDSWTFALNALGGKPLAPAEADNRYGVEAWRHWPYNVYANSYRNVADWWQAALAGVPGVEAANARTLKLMGSNALEAVSPANYLATNPELLDTTRAESGRNLLRGMHLWLKDLELLFARDAVPRDKPFVVGRDVAVTPGKVVMRNPLVELIQYDPVTPSVYAEPIVILPAWIMKYYILDLSPANSLVRYLVSQGHTVFMVSWKNPGPGDRDLGLDDYLQLGVRDVIETVAAIAPQSAMHMVGYCIGGTLLSIAAAAMAAQGERRIASLSLLAAQTDFSEPGELSLFISPAQLEMLEAAMQRTGVLTAEQMGGAFALLRSRDLLWVPAVNKYLRGQEIKPNDLMSWNADGTRMPCRMHTEYLRELYLHNKLARGEFVAQGERVDLSAVRWPMFVVGTETDHVAPWRSVYKARGLTRSNDYTFLLTSGGHNAGIVSGPVHPRRRHRMLSWSDETTSLSPEDWQHTAVLTEGSWWPSWQRWLVAHSSPTELAARVPGSDAAGFPALSDAPGDYVKQA